MRFLKSDTLLLPIRNATVEEYSHYLVNRIVENENAIREYDVREMTIKVSSGAGQWGSATWTRD